MATAIIAYTWLAVTVPAQAITGRLTLDTLALATGFAIVVLVLSRAFFRIGLRRYSGASARPA